MARIVIRHRVLIRTGMGLWNGFFNRIRIGRSMVIHKQCIHVLNSLIKVDGMTLSLPAASTLRLIMPANSRAAVESLRSFPQPYLIYFTWNISETEKVIGNDLLRKNNPKNLVNENILFTVIIMIRKIARLIYS